MRERVYYKEEEEDVIVYKRVRWVMVFIVSNNT